MRLRANHVEAFFDFLVRFAVGAAMVASVAWCTSSEAGERVISHHDERGAVVSVVILAGDCPNAPGRGCAIQALYIGGNERRIPHELAHIAGMKHEPWQRNGFGMECARVTKSGFQTGYRVGEIICAGFDGSDLRE